MEGKSIRHSIIIIDDNKITQKGQTGIEMNTVKTEDVEAFSDHRIEQYVDPRPPVNIPQKIVTRKLSKRVVRLSKIIDIITSITAVTTSAVCSGLSSSKDIPVYQRQLTVFCAIIGGICACMGGVKSIVLDSLKKRAKNYNNDQYSQNVKIAQQIENVESGEDKPVRKASSRKLPDGVVLISKLIDIITAIAAVATGAVCSVLGENGKKDDNNVYQKYLMYICAVVGGVCGCIGTAKSQFLDVLKGCIKDKNAKQPDAK